LSCATLYWLLKRNPDHKVQPGTKSGSWLSVRFWARGFFIAITWFYTSLIVLWFILHGWLGDAVWWMALLNVFTPYLFLPLVLLLPVALFCRWRPLRVSVLPPVIVFLLLYGVLFLPALMPSSADDGTVLTAMSFNVWGFSRSPTTARAIVNGDVPDIVALQELAPEMAQVLAQELGHIYPYHIMDNSQPWSGLGIFSRYPLKELDAGRFSNAGWRVQILQTVVQGQRITVYNVHMPSWNYWTLIGTGMPIASQIQRNIQARNDLAQQLADDIAGRSSPVIVMGDLNSTDQSDVYATLTGILADAHRSAGKGFGHTFPAYGGRYRGIPIVPRQVRIDMILHSPELTAVYSDVGSAHGESDHLPVLAKLAWQ
jgi:endonuclease/exonuclease/phosphatase (EEP) superfamily protein YafD